MVVSYKPKDTDKLQTHDEISRVGSIEEYQEHVDSAMDVPEPEPEVTEAA